MILLSQIPNKQKWYIYIFARYKFYYINEILLHVTYFGWSNENNSLKNFLILLKCLCSNLTMMKWAYEKKYCNLTFNRVSYQVQKRQDPLNKLTLDQILTKLNLFLIIDTSSKCLLIFTQIAVSDSQAIPAFLNRICYQ